MQLSYGSMNKIAGFKEGCENVPLFALLVKRIPGKVKAIRDQTHLSLLRCGKTSDQNHSRRCSRHIERSAGGMPRRTDESYRYVPLE